MSHRLKRLAPWILSLGIVGFLFATTDLEAVGAALGRADWPRFIALMAVVTVTAYLLDALTLVPLFRRFVGPVTVSEVLRVKGVSYFFNAITYSLAAGAMAWILHRARKIPFLETFSSLVWFFFVDVIALSGLLTVGYVAGGREAMADVSFVDEVPAFVAVVWAVVLGALAFWNGRFDFVILGRLRPWRIFDAFRRARLRDYPAMIAMRMGFIMVYVVMHLVLLPTFGVEIPLGLLLIYAPLIAFVQVIPATISGLGAVQGVMVALFAGHVPAALGDGQAVIVAYSTVLGPTMMLMRLLIGYAFVSRVAADLVPSKEAIAAMQEAATHE